MAGDGVFQGYWNRPVENGKAFLQRDDVRWYNAGDVYGSMLTTDTCIAAGAIAW